jgi:hypothetical protein
MGHGSMPAALSYQHATTERDRQIADTGALVDGSGQDDDRADRSDDDEGDGPPASALVPVAQ